MIIGSSSTLLQFHRFFKRFQASSSRPRSLDYDSKTRYTILKGSSLNKHSTQLLATMTFEDANDGGGGEVCEGVRRRDFNVPKPNCRLSGIAGIVGWKKIDIKLWKIENERGEWRWRLDSRADRCMQMVFSCNAMRRRLCENKIKSS